MREENLAEVTVAGQQPVRQVIGGPHAHLVGIVGTRGDKEADGCLVEGRGQRGELGRFEYRDVHRGNVQDLGVNPVEIEHLIVDW
ncbi:MAG: hypothetical protein QOE32_745 [Pseudonocardiales bacterium]|jgi:hypothetical protein|nr:hypothetical protein [Pseudonocardiales bacterium]